MRSPRFAAPSPTGVVADTNVQDSSARRNGIPVVVAHLDDVVVRVRRAGLRSQELLRSVIGCGRVAQSFRRGFNVDVRRCQARRRPE